MTNVTKAIIAINFNAEVSVNAEDINQITWLNGTPPVVPARDGPYCNKNCVSGSSNPVPPPTRS